MSFSSDVKDELSQLPLKNLIHQMYELEGMLRLSSEIIIESSGLKISFQTTNANVARRFLQLLKNYVKAEVEIVSKKVNRLNQNNIYYININSMSDALLDEFGLLTTSPNQDEILSQDENISAYLRGVFLVKGSVNSPDSSNYHLEVYTTSGDDAIFIQALMNHYDLNAKITKRRDNYVIYMKALESIKDFLRIIGSVTSAFKLEEAQIERELHSNVQRKLNIEVANDSKALKSANEQLKYIRYLEYNYPLEKLDGRLLLIMKVRKQNPEASLNELIEILKTEHDEVITKSGLNHRLNRIKEIAMNLMERKAKS
jgi:cell division protein WhiA